MRPTCRLCDRRAVEGSLFCSQHREQAERFSLAFGKQDEDAEETPGPAAPEADDGTGSAPAAAEEPTTAEPEELDEDRAVLGAAFHPAFDELRTRLKESADPGRWPQLSIYFLDDTLHCRAYFSIVPRTNGAEGPESATYALDEDRVHAALATGGIVFEELYACFRDNAAALRDREIQTLDVHFLTYAGLIAINRHPSGGKMDNLVTFEVGGSGFRKVELDDDVRARMRHCHW